MNEIILDMNYFYDGKIFNKINIQKSLVGTKLLTEEGKVIAITNCATEIAHVILNLEAGKYA